MSGAVISSNTTVKISAAVDNSASTTTANLYTCPANSYAILNALVDNSGGSGAGYISVAGNPVATGLNLTGGAGAGATNIYVGPGQTVSCTVTSGSCNFYINGVEFINSP